jgi:hypothetical protein
MFAVLPNKQMIILYDGIGCNTTGKHTKDEFLNIMNREFTHKIWRHELAIIPREQHYQLTFNDWILPDDFIFFTLTDWIEYSGAVISE